MPTLFPYTTLFRSAFLAYELNGTQLGNPHGAPIRLRFERQLGYKQSKYVTMIEFGGDAVLHRQREGRISFGGDTEPDNYDKDP